MSDPIPPGGLEITPTPPLWLQAQGQLRIWLGLLLGLFVAWLANQLHLQILNQVWGQQGPEVVGLIVAAITQGAMAFWQWARTKFVNARWWHVAIDDRVSNDVVRPAIPVQPKEQLP